ncbi:hypothetical protein AKJ35_00390 [candidate division MSBL1 archaeon SCGC-AAA833F18]|uniref:DUF2029 domain-containing protein n=4 Tax=candidate division MSBL1 TaxID=215777 RepID=A0A133V4R2_9EURY|nr:hypothetical protein AKJ44_02545 [candidate division MSBL1 archaeon SCGC-AAA261F17]KXB03765.1 hypothetical protein AKJ47_01680 [candidate division MSBL1 archaeon SCGC-AAA261G05]KXB04758.1 hypothetical protein AKJ48_01500 [candidate division MSBL1 archaeon SCGC-AAA261O19]KXB09604.1 hypothetical protein AKJ35_00390 [candidate division MSBL1 archaeon SCGC-AAA833F18]
MEELTYEARSDFGASWSSYYLYYTYPPMPMFIYYPFAQAYRLIHPTPSELSFAPAGVDPYPQVPLTLNLLWKLPIFLADIGIAILLLKMTNGSEKSMRMFLFNPFVIFISACWMFDSIAVFFLLLATYLFEQERYDLSAILLAFGFLTKYYPIFALPIFCLEFIRRKSWKFFRYTLIFGAVSFIFILPFLDGFTLGLGFQASRPPAGLTPFAAYPAFEHLGLIGGEGMNHLAYIALPALGAFTLITGMSLIYAYLSKKEMSLRTKLLLTFIVYLIVTKNVHEPYPFVLIPFFILLLHENFSKEKLWMYRLVWILPLMYAVFNVPITRFLYGFTLNEEILTFLVLPTTINAIILGSIMIVFHLTLWRALIKLRKG